MQNCINAVKKTLICITIELGLLYWYFGLNCFCILRFKRSVNTSWFIRFVHFNRQTHFMFIRCVLSFFLFPSLLIFWCFCFCSFTGNRKLCRYKKNIVVSPMRTADQFAANIHRQTAQPKRFIGHTDSLLSFVSNKK